MEQIFSSTTIFELCVFAAVVLTFVIQVVVYLGYSLVATHKHQTNKSLPSEPHPAVSILVVIGADFKFLENCLPKLLDQKYDGEWEVVVVNDCGGKEIEHELERIAASEPKLRHTTIRQDKRFKHSRKIPLLIGIKAARYSSILIADSSGTPTTDKWLALMARGFESGELVIGYTGFENGTNPLIRSSRFAYSVRYLKAAIVGTPYRGIYNNIGYSKDIFFRSRGFTHLRLTLGEDDLFVQKIAPYCHASVMLSSTVMVRQHAPGGLLWWWNEQRYRTYSHRYYPRSVRLATFGELCFRLLFFVSVVLMAILPIDYLWIYASIIFLLRELLVVWIMGKIMKRLGEKGLRGAFLVYEFFEPIFSVILWISRRSKPSARLWK